MKLFIFLVLFTLGSHPGFSQDPPQTELKLHYLTVEDILAIEDGLQSPTPDSSEDQKDYVKIDQIISKRTDEQCAQATKQMKQTFESFFGDLIPASDIPKLIPLLGQVEDDFGIPVYRVKMKIERVRPLDRKADLKLCPGHKRKEGGYPKDSFPSGHAASGYIEALILSDIYKSKTKELMVRGDQIGWNRVAIGVHHPSDVIAGQTMAKRAYQRFRSHGTFRKAFKAVRQSINAKN